MRLVLTAEAPKDEALDLIAQLVRWARYYGFTGIDVDLKEGADAPR